MNQDMDSQIPRDKVSGRKMSCIISPLQQHSLLVVMISSDCSSLGLVLFFTAPGGTNLLSVYSLIFFLLCYHLLPPFVFCALWFSDRSMFYLTYSALYCWSQIKPWPIRPAYPRHPNKSVAVQRCFDVTLETAADKTVHFVAVLKPFEHCYLRSFRNCVTVTQTAVIFQF